MDRMPRLHLLALAALSQTRGWSEVRSLDNDRTASEVTRPDGEAVVVTRLYRQRSAPLSDIARGCHYAARLAAGRPERATLIVNTSIPDFLQDALHRETGVEIIDGEALVRLAAKGEFATLNDIQQAIDESFR